MNSTISDVDLRDNKVGAAGAEALAEMLKVNATVRTVKLVDCSIGHDGCKARVDHFRVQQEEIGGNKIAKAYLYSISVRHRKL